MRAGDWWEYKLVPILSVFYATALLLRAPLVSLWPAALILLLSIVPGAAYVSLINDLTDRADDFAAGKPNRTAGLSLTTIAALIAVTAGAGAVFMWLWRRDALLLVCYLAAWLAFSLYSLPPFRFKVRGLPGVLCDAGGAHLFPTLVAAALAFRGAHRAVSGMWMTSVGVWALAYGLRGILWHQLSDAENDRTAGVRTLAQRHPRAAEHFGTFAAFPIEAASFAVVLWQLRSAWTAGALALYALMALRRARRWRMNPVVVVPKPRFFMVLQEYYDVFLPLALLSAASMRDGRDLAVLAVHLVLFPRRVLQTLRDLWRIPREMYGDIPPAFKFYKR